MLAKKKETSKEVELQKLKIVEQEKKNEGMKEKKEVIDITNAGDIEKERLRNKFRLELYRGKHQEKQVRDAMAKEKTRREQEKKLMYTSSSMRYTAMENGGKFQLNGGGTHGIAMQNNREREMWREMQLMRDSASASSVASYPTSIQVDSNRMEIEEEDEYSFYDDKKETLVIDDWYENLKLQKA